MGAIGKDKDGFAIFPDVNTGYQAIGELLDSSSYRNLTAEKAMYRYAPPADKNDTKAYVNFLAKSGVPINKKLKDMSPEEKATLTRAIAQYESGKMPGNHSSQALNSQAFNVQAPSAQYASSQPAGAMQGKELSPEERYQLSRELAGLEDHRTALERNYDFISQVMGEEAAQQQITGSDDKKFNIDRQIQLFEEDLALRYGPDWRTNAQAVDEYKTAMNELAIKQRGGVADVSDAQNRKLLGENLQLGRQAISKPLTPSQREYAKLNEAEMELDKKDWYKQNTKVARGAKDTYREIKEFNQELNSIKPENAEKEIWRGPIDQYKTWVTSYLPTVKIWDDEAQQAFARSVGTKTKLGMIITNYIKSMSGLAVTDAERQLFMDMLQASEDKNLPALKEAMKTFESVIRGRGLEASRNLIERGAVGTGTDYLDDLDYYGGKPSRQSSSQSAVEQTMDKSKLRAVTTSADLRRTPNSYMEKGGCTYYNIDGQPFKEC
jgi:hypothetical protein